MGLGKPEENKLATRYIPNQATAITVAGNPAVFTPTRIGRDGTLGYTGDEVKHVDKKTLKALFRTIEVEADVIETATAAPGQKRSTKPRTKKATK